MNKLLTTTGLVALCISSTQVIADTTLYGKAHVAIASESPDGGTTSTDLESRASRFGVKGNHDLSDGLQAIYQWETEVKYDGDAVDGDELQLKARNTFVGLTGGFGTLKAGINDTPMKQAEGKIDVFSDREDMGNVLKNYLDTQEREKNFLGYYSPKMGSAKAQFAIATMEGKAGGQELGDAWSSSLTFGDKKLKKANYYAAIAYDSEVDAKDSSAVRLAGSTKVGGVKLGLILEQADRDGYDKQNRYIASAAYKMGKNTLLFQHANADEALKNNGTSDSHTVDSSATSIGLDHKIGDNTKVYGMFSATSKGSVDTDKFSLGLEHNF